jgi:hypothetical protein
MALVATPENLLSVSTSTKKGPVIKRYKKLEDDRSSWRSHYMELSDYLAPRRGRFLIEDTQNTRGRKRNNKIIDSTGTQALRTMSAGMMSGMTNPSRPWHRRTIMGDPELMDFQPVKEWVDQVVKIERSILNASNFYTSMSSVYTELGSFGTAPLYRQPTFTNLMRFRPFTAGEYVISENDLGIVDTLGRYFTMTVWQIVAKFVQKPDGKMDWRGVSKTTISLWDNGNYDSLIPVIHMIEPRPLAERDTRRKDQMNMPFRSIYFEYGGEGDDILFEGGHKSFPAYVPRWDVLWGDVYGRSPGMDALGDIKQLQHQQKRKAQAIDKMVNPPMVANVSLRGKPTSTLPGQNTYVDPSMGGAGFQPAYIVQPRINEMMMDIQEVQQRIQRGFYADLFAMMINSDRRQMTATEVAERHEEKLVLLGPVLQRLNVELLDPLLDDVFEYALEAGLLPEPPKELEGMDLGVEYVSLLAQAQQAVGASAIERAAGFAGNMSAVFPEVIDVVDADDMLRNYFEIVGAPATSTKDDETVKAARKARSDQAEAQAGMEQAGQMAQSAKVLSEADTQNPNALTDLLGGGATVG